MTQSIPQLPELLPCPFCGGADTYAMDMGGWESFCKTCGTNGPALNTGKDKVIADWNTRAARPLAVAVIPEGWKLVPIEPDSNMMNSAPDAWHSWKSRDNGGNIQQLGKMMWERYLNAAPSIGPSTQGVDHD